MCMRYTSNAYVDAVYACMRYGLAALYEHAYGVHAIYAVANLNTMHAGETAQYAFTAYMRPEAYMQNGSVRYRRCNTCISCSHSLHGYMRSTYVAYVQQSHDIRACIT
jgi:hypothetical protein